MVTVSFYGVSEEARFSKSYCGLLVVVLHALEDFSKFFCFRLYCVFT